MKLRTSAFNIKPLNENGVRGLTREYFELMDRVEFNGQNYRVISFNQVPEGTHEFIAMLETLFPADFYAVGLASSGEFVWLTLGGQKEMTEDETQALSNLGHESFCRKYTPFSP